MLLLMLPAQNHGWPSHTKPASELELDPLPEAPSFYPLVDNVEFRETSLDNLVRERGLAVALTPGRVVPVQCGGLDRPVLVEDKFLVDKPLQVVGALLPELVCTFHRVRNLET